MAFFDYSVSEPLTRFGPANRIYPDPFRSHTTMFIPRTVTEMLRWCEGVWLKNGTYSRALSRVVSYFLTRLEISNFSGNSKRINEQLINDDLQLLAEMYKVGTDFMCYGNSFTMLFPPFLRSLECPKCHIILKLDEVGKYKFESKKFHWRCRHCNKDVQCGKPNDNKLNDVAKVHVHRLNPHEMQVIEHPISGRKQYLWDPPQDIITKIKQGDSFYIQDFPWEMIEAICDDKMFEFADGVVYHCCNSSLSGIKAKGWGISPMMHVFHLAYYVQTAKLFNEVLMNEYIIPFRVVSPAKGNGPTGDPLQNSSVGNYNSRLLRMLDEHRRSPGGYYALPFPVEYQAISGEGAQLTTHEHINAATDEMLNAVGVPSELYKGTIQFQALPTALRLFQQTWPGFVKEMNNWAQWCVDQLAELYNIDAIKVKLQPVTLADDIENRNILLQLLAGNRISSQTALAPLGLDPKEEGQRILTEQEESQEMQEEYQQRQQQRQQLMSEMQQGGQAQGQAQGQGGMGGGQPGPQNSAWNTANMSPEDMQNAAMTEAQRMLQLPYEVRRTQMSQLRSTGGDTLWMLVKGQMEKMRSTARSQGGYDALQQMVNPQQPQ